MGVNKIFCGRRSLQKAAKNPKNVSRRSQLDQLENLGHMHFFGKYLKRMNTNRLKQRDVKSVGEIRDVVLLHVGENLNWRNISRDGGKDLIKMYRRVLL